MKEDREPMERMEAEVPVVEVSSLRSSSPRFGAGQAIRPLDPEVVAKPARRQFTTV